MASWSQFQIPERTNRIGLDRVCASAGLVNYSQRDQSHTVYAWLLEAGPGLA